MANRRSPSSRRMIRSRRRKAPTRSRRRRSAAPATLRRRSAARRRRSASSPPRPPCSAPPHGATPQTPRAAALASTTPAQADALPIEVASFAHATLAPATPARPDYASLIDPGKLDREKRCLAEAVYFEARSEPEDGTGGGGASGAEPRLLRPLSVQRLRRRLSEPQRTTRPANSPSPARATGCASPSRKPGRSRRASPTR